MLFEIVKWSKKEREREDKVEKARDKYTQHELIFFLKKEMRKRKEDIGFATDIHIQNKCTGAKKDRMK